LVSEDDAVVIFLAKHSLCDAYACLCAFLKSLFATCDKTIPNYRKSTTRKPTGKSIWNNNIAEATKNAKIKYNQWRNAGNPKRREKSLKSQHAVCINSSMATISSTIFLMEF
jgi:signal recognition particle subunit SEC65